MARPRRGVEDLEAAREQFREIAADLSGDSSEIEKEQALRDLEAEIRKESLTGQSRSKEGEKTEAGIFICYRRAVLSCVIHSDADKQPHRFVRD
jgi:hypothetical protein